MRLVRTVAVCAATVAVGVHYFVLPVIEKADELTPWSGVVPGSCGTPPAPEPAGWAGMANDAGNLLHSIAEGPPTPNEMVGWFRDAGEGAGVAWAAFEGGTKGQQLLPLAPTPEPLTAQVGLTTSDPKVRIAQALIAAGATDLEAVRLTAITAEESRYGADLVNPTSSARGPFQIMLTSHPSMTEADAMDLNRSAAYALRLAREDGGKGIDRHWAQTVKAAEGHYAEAQAAVAQARGAAPVACEPTPGIMQASAPTGIYPNGNLPAHALAPVPGGQRLRVDAAAAFHNLQAAFRAHFGTELVLTSGYRTFAEQAAVRRAKPGLAAPAGKSNHGEGIALDLGSGVNRFGTPQHEWMRANAGRYGWHHPTWARIDGSKPEAWHWELMEQGTAAG